MVTTRPNEADASLAARIGSFADTIAALVGEGDPQWRQALREVPRHLFIPPTGWGHVYRGPSQAIDRDADEAAWWQAVYSSASITTQADDGQTDPAAGTGMATSAASQPDLVLAFLDLLDVQDGHRVLEIGTGTGWTAVPGPRVTTNQDTTTSRSPSTVGGACGTRSQPPTCAGSPWAARP